MQSASPSQVPAACASREAAVREANAHGEALRDPRRDNDNDSDCHISTDGTTIYGDYLQLEKLLSCQEPFSSRFGNSVDDEHLFIVTHQVYELWFKQILFDLDKVRELFYVPVLDESLTLLIVSKLERLSRIMQLLVDQMSILETMSPLDFVEFRRYLAPASGFQSVQFRMLENKLGVEKENRLEYGGQPYACVFHQAEDKMRVALSESSPSLLRLLERWLERTPGLEVDGFDFWTRYKQSVSAYLNDLLRDSENCPVVSQRARMRSEYEKTREAFKTVLNPDRHDQLRTTGDRRISHKAMQGALMISFYRETPRFSQPYEILRLLMDLDSLLTKWRYNHVMMVQRMLGNKQGTGGSSGYGYLRATCGDRYKVFVDLFNLSTFLVPRRYIAPLTKQMFTNLSYPTAEALTDDLVLLFNRKFCLPKAPDL